MVAIVTTAIVLCLVTPTAYKSPREGRGQMKQETRWAQNDMTPSPISFLPWEVWGHQKPPWGSEVGFGSQCSLMRAGWQCRWARACSCLKEGFACPPPG